MIFTSNFVFSGRESANHHINDCSATTRRSRRGQKFAGVARDGGSDDEHGLRGGDISTGVTVTSRTSRFVTKDTSVGDGYARNNGNYGHVMTTINGALAPPTAI